MLQYTTYDFQRKEETMLADQVKLLLNFVVFYPNLKLWSPKYHNISVEYVPLINKIL